ncbi:hypothetical protein Bpfe_019313 [Biomphalaria pfeifferi]|uniref:Uncharacterized protein n=1 Tax=Biomphalaria pfeifferi TaxID=112525 RepID=A0AAD8BD20_BIOPF|nr:hypothetical protein Bpfe_019313 [Biomphalaria pfeifferi]
MKSGDSSGFKQFLWISGVPTNAICWYVKFLTNASLIALYTWQYYRIYRILLFNCNREHVDCMGSFMDDIVL